MSETVICVVGNLTADPELRFTKSGQAVASFTIASTPRVFDKAASEWKDGEALFLRASCWREFAENVAGSLAKGMRVVAQGKLKQRSFTDKDGKNRTSIELDVDEVGPSLRYATAQVARNAAGRSQAGRGDANGDGVGSDTSSMVSGAQGPDSSNWSTALPGDGLPF